MPPGKNFWVTGNGWDIYCGAMGTPPEEAA